MTGLHLANRQNFILFNSVFVVYLGHEVVHRVALLVLPRISCREGNRYPQARSASETKWCSSTVACVLRALFRFGSSCSCFALPTTHSRASRNTLAIIFYARLCLARFSVCANGRGSSSHVGEPCALEDVGHQQLSALRVSESYVAERLREVYWDSRVQTTPLDSG